jgi:MFS transporter, SP family, sugar:H+ symporter
LFVFFRVADRTGRRYAMVSECCVFAVGVIVQLTTSPEWQQVAIGRLISGLAVGALSAAVPMVML